MDDDEEGTPPGKEYMDEIRKAIASPKSDMESSEAKTEYFLKKGNNYIL